MPRPKDDGAERTPQGVGSARPREKLLVLGGTGFVGRAVVEAAAQAGWEPTLFHRNRSGPGLFPDLERIVGDRTKNLTALRGRRWDAVIDTCGYDPEDVSASVAALGDRVGLYVYISSVMAYRDWGARRQNESSPLMPEADGRPLSETASYRARRAACDRRVREALGDRALVVRPGLLVGPHDPAETLAYWLLRCRRGGQVLAPGRPSRRVQILDVRDLAGWLVAMASRREGGTFNAFGREISMRALLEACRDVSGGGARFHWVEDDFLSERLSSRRDVRERPLQFIETLPFWIPGLDDRFDSAAALRRGLRRRPLRDTARAVLLSLGKKPALAREFLSPDREAELLAQWRLRRARRGR